MTSSRTVNRATTGLVAVLGLVTAGFSAAGGTPASGHAQVAAPYDVVAAPVVAAPVAADITAQYAPAVLFSPMAPVARTLPLPTSPTRTLPLPTKSRGLRLNIDWQWNRPRPLLAPYLSSLVRFMTPRKLSSGELAEVEIARTYPNGRIPAAYLCSVGPDLLRCDAARAFLAMDTAFRMRFGRSIALTDGYRSLTDQFSVKRHWIEAGRGFMAASPGTSNHGLGLAVDLAGPEGRGGTPEHTWLARHAPTFGWEWPLWARQQPKYEPWHFEFVTADTNRPDPAVPMPWRPIPRPPVAPPPPTVPVPAPVVPVPTVTVTPPVPQPTAHPTQTVTATPSPTTTTAVPTVTVTVSPTTTSIPTVTVSVPSTTSSSTTTVTVTTTVIPTTTIPVPTITTTVTTSPTETPTETAPTGTEPTETCTTQTAAASDPGATTPTEVPEPCAVVTLVDVPPVSPEPPPDASGQVTPTPTAAPIS